jgi:hypothetical protein
VGRRLGRVVVVDIRRTLVVNRGKGRRENAGPRTVSKEHGNGVQIRSPF